MSLLVFQLQMWIEDPTQQLIFKNALDNIEAPYNGKPWNKTEQLFIFSIVYTCTCIITIISGNFYVIA